MKNIQITVLIYEMLIVASRRRRMKPNELISRLIEKDYQSNETKNV
jgi:hypothetical protein